MKKKIVASELSDAEVKFISLVGKGANRIPIRFLKEEDRTMIKGFENLFMKETSEPYIAAFVVNEGANMKEATSLISKAGFSLDDKEENKEEGVVIYHQHPAPKDLPNQYVIKMNDSIGIHVVCSKAFNPTDFETTSFKELFNKAGVLPNIFMAHDILKEATMNILFSEDTVDSTVAAKKVRKAINEFNTVVTGMIESIPVSAFKMDDPALLETVKKELDQKNKEDSEKEEESKEDTGATKSEKEDEEKADEEAEEEAEEEDKEEEEEAKEVEKSETEEESEEDNATLAGIAKALGDITGEIASLKESVSGIDELKDSMSKLEGEVERVSKVAESNDEALNGTTNATPEDDRSETKKTHPTSRRPLGDTGYAKVVI